MISMTSFHGIVNAYFSNVSIVEVYAEQVRLMIKITRIIKVELSIRLGSILL